MTSNNTKQASKPLKNDGNLLTLSERKHLEARKRRGVMFKALTLLPVVLAIGLILALLGDVLVGSVSWQVVEPRGSSQTFSWAESFRGFSTWKQVVSLELSAQGLDAAEIDGLFHDKERLRKFRLRNRVQFVWLADGKSWRWLVSNSRDKRIDDIGVFKGFSEQNDLLAGLEDGQILYLNPWFDVAFFQKNASRTPIMAGLISALVGSLWVISFVVVFSLPIGVGTAVYLEEYAPDNGYTRFLEVNLRNLAGVPSIVYGILGLSVFVRLMQIGPTVLAASLTLSLLILPVVVIASREAIRGVPDSLREASYGLGATRWQTVSRIVLPNAMNGIVTGMILSVARAIGETAPLLLVGAAAFVPRLPEGPLSTYTVIPIQIYSWIAENDAEFQHVASSGIITLLGVLVILYSIAFFVRRRFERNW
ncbi:MAG: phosphate ABC transporter, permease protein PstA [Trueperaceae bacterium]|jgi:phosphate transport system permease protein|nr:phosphate ABC transporter, permease protein PstA [Trueperaceae bacterium]|tara:strand:+ start:11126 stop:12391 length:1266 start_codon:yes stop_codon:yes gene_type:complete